MKKTMLPLRRFVPALLLVGGLSSLAIAQKTPAPRTTDSKPDARELNVRIIERNGDQVREVERTYRINGLSDTERERLVTRLVDSLKATRPDAGKRQMTIIVDDNNDQTITINGARPNRRLPNNAFGGPNGPIGARPFVWEWDGQALASRLRRGTDSLADRLNRYRYQFSFPQDFDRQLVRPFENWSRGFSNAKPSTVRGLDAYPNNPDRNQLNVRFTAPAKGDVLIVVTNPKGKEVARRELKDFSGEFVGQIDLGRKPVGTYFITVTQNDDGAVKRIVVE